MNWDRIEGQWKQFKGASQQAMGEAHGTTIGAHPRQDARAGRQGQSLYGRKKDDAET